MASQVLRLILLTAFSQLAISKPEVPAPTITYSPKPQRQTYNRLTYFETEKINLKCSLPPTVPDSISLMFTAWQILPSNPIVIKTTPGGEGHALTLDIAYDKSQFAMLVNVWCEAKTSSDEVVSDSYIQIEQEYKTNNVYIKGESSLYVETGDKVELECMADGYPFPEYQWFNNSEAIENEKKYKLLFKTPNKWATVGEFVCGAKNQYNEDFVNSTSVVVSASKAPVPSIEAITKPIQTSGKKYTYQAATKVTLRCFVASPETDDFTLTMTVEKIEPGNPLYPDENVTFALTNENSSSIVMEIVYNPEKFVPWVKVTCTSTRDFQSRISSAMIEQKFSAEELESSTPAATKITAEASTVPSTTPGAASSSKPYTLLILFFSSTVVVILTFL